MSQSMNVAEPPVVSEAQVGRKKSKKVKRIKQKALVVEADYYALTCRVDKNVIFWDPGFARKGVPKIPRGVTHLWIHRLVADDSRINLRAQARARGIEIWTCSVGELRLRLLPFWSEPTNRSLVKPVQPDEDGGRELEQSLGLQDDDQLAAVMETVEEKSERLHKARRLRDLKETGRKFAILKARMEREEKKAKVKVVSGAPKPTIHLVIPKREPKPTSAKSALRMTRRFSVRELLGPHLGKLQGFDRDVFLYHYEQSRGDDSRTADEFAMPRGNVSRTLERCWMRLRQSGFEHNSQWLLATLYES